MVSLAAQLKAHTVPAKLSQRDVKLRTDDLLRIAARLVGVPHSHDAFARARAVSACALNTYWTTRHGRDDAIAECPLSLVPLDTLDGQLATTFGEGAAKLPPSVATYLLSSLYAALLPAAIRSQQGVFFTPPPLVERLLDLLEEAGADWSRHRVLDPAAGGGAFLAPVATRMVSALQREGADPRAVLNHIQRHLSGIEIDPFSGWMSNVILESVLWEDCLGGTDRLTPLTCSQDALEVPEIRQYDVVVGNPPYGRVTLPDEVRQRFARSVFGHANLYGVFTDLALRLAVSGGLIGYVTPTSFLGGLYFKNLRSVLTAEAPPVAIDFISDRGNVFDGVLQETLLVVYRSLRPAEDVRLAEIETTSFSERARITVIGGQPALPASDAPWVLPRSRAAARLLHSALRSKARLSDYGYRISTGPLVWNRHRDQLVDDELPGVYPLIWAESVCGPGVFELRAAQRNHKAYFLARPGQEHLVQRDSCVLLQRTTAKEQPRRLVAAVLPKAVLDPFHGAIVENHLNVIRAAGDRAKIDLDSIAALLNASIIDDLFRCINGSVAVSAYELESLPLPDPAEMDEFGVLVREGAPSQEIESFLLSAFTGPQ
jgi:adenine-specific DNA-methyltransferase